MEVKAFKAHALWVSMDACRAAAADLDPKATSNLADRVDAVISYVMRYKNAGDADLFSEALLANMNAQFEQLNANLGYAQQNPESYASRVHSALDSIVTAAAGWPTPWRTNTLTSSMQSQLDSFVERVEQRRLEHEAEIERLQGEIAERDEEIADLTQQAAKLKSQLEAQEATVASQLSGLSSTFDETQTQRSQSFDEWLTEKQGELNQVRRDNEVALETYETRASDELDKIHELHASVENVTSKVASAVLAKDFGKYARNQMIAAIISFVTGAALVIWAGTELAGAINTAGPGARTSWQWVALKFGLSATIIGGASVALTLGNKFLKQSTNAKRMDLELRAIGPYLADVDEEEAQATKVGIANRAFGHVWASEEGRSDDGEEKLSVGTMAQVLEMCVKASKSL